jgi:hypothetical protein
MAGGRRVRPGRELPNPALEAARRVWRSAAGSAPQPADVAWAAGRICAGLRIGLARWIGGEGYRALLARALGEAATAHPALAGLTCLGDEEPAIERAVQVHGAVAVGAGMMALLTAMIDVLGMIMGTEMAVRLVEQGSASSPQDSRRGTRMEDDDG